MTPQQNQAADKLAELAEQMKVEQEALGERRECVA